MIAIEVRTKEIQEQNIQLKLKSNDDIEAQDWACHDIFLRTMLPIRQ